MALRSGERQPNEAPAAVLDEARRTIGRDILAGESGVSALARYAAHVDADLRRLYAEAGEPGRPAALIAIGGYGRRHLCPYSDIDLLVLFGGAVEETEERFLRRLLHPLWDAGLVVGHQVRDAAELAQLEVDNPEFLVALTDARLVVGEPALFERLRASFHVPRTHAHVLGALQELTEARHARFNATLYQLEPDVKDAPGALRDIAAARTIAAMTDPALLRRGREDVSSLALAEDFLLRVRSLVHLERRRNDNRLSHELQEKLAVQFDYPGPTSQQRVEALMAGYFRHARAVARVLDRARRTAPVPVAPNLGRTHDGVRFIDAHKAAIQPATWLAAFQSALDAETSVADDTLDVIRQHAGRFAIGDLLPTAEHRTALLAFLTPRPGLYDRLSELHDSGLLARLIPPFEAITCRVVRDFYHKYTVDEHTLLTIRNLERLADAPEHRQRFASIARDLPSPELLVLALLLHDVGKGAGDEDHAVASVRLAERLLDEWRLADAARETVIFLIRHHLRMSQVAFRRDTEDPEIVREFAALVGTEERLKLLCLMTLADVEAVSPETLTRWKEELLWRLYVDTYNYLTRHYGDDLIERTQAAAAEIVSRRPADLGAPEVAAFLEGLPRRYLQLFDRRTIYQHVRLARDIHPDEVHLRLDPTDAAWQLTVVTLDKPMLFANMCGVLSSFGMDILQGHAMTNPNGLVLDVVQFTDSERFLALNPGGVDAVLHALEDVVAGRSTAADRLRGRRDGLGRRPARRAAIVHADAEASRRYTVLEIIAPDEFGLLYRISRAIATEGCAIDLVLIATEGDKAIDVFHITKDGAKLTAADQRMLTEHLQQLLENKE
jgi:[protein-PII] uridylyltransferase